MRGTLRTGLLVLVAALFLVAGAAWAEEGPTREEYVAKVDPICKSNTDANKPLLKAAKKLGNAGKYDPAAAKVGRAVQNFGKTVAEIEAVPRPPADSPRLEKWFKFLRIVKLHLGEVQKALKEENRTKAVHAEIKTERSSNAANNVGFVFGFKYCRFKTS